MVAFFLDVVLVIFVGVLDALLQGLVVGVGDHASLFLGLCLGSRCTCSDMLGGLAGNELHGILLHPVRPLAAADDLNTVYLVLLILLLYKTHGEPFSLYP